MSVQRNRGVGRPRKISIRDINKPKHPLSGYFQFVLDRRKELGPQWLGQFEHTRDTFSVLGSEWRNLDESKRNEYIEKAEDKRLKYQEELKKYMRSESYKDFQRQLSEQRGGKKLCKAEESKIIEDTFVGDIPVFTKEFLEHNKEREAELRRLRSEVSRLEEEEKALLSNVDRLTSACEQSQNELDKQKTCCTNLDRHLALYTKTLVSVFGHLPLPDHPNGMSENNVESYMTKLHCIVTSTASENQDLINKIRDAAKRIKMPTVS